jgi:hypothetical protein
MMRKKYWIGLDINMKISKSNLVKLIEQMLKEDYSGLSLEDEIKHFTQQIDAAADKKDLPTLLKMYKGLGDTVQKASKEMRMMPNR